MIYAVVCVAAFLTAALTLFTGFGLGTLLLPVLALFFPVEVSVSATAVVHLLNNLFKLALVGRDAERRVVLAFGVPAAAAAMLGAHLLSRLTELPSLVEYRFAGQPAVITPVKLVIAVLIFVFAVVDLLPGGPRVSVGPRWIPLGGVLSGFAGGLSGHQGALRAAFLIKAGLSREAFIGSSVVCAVMVDVARLAVYGRSFLGDHLATLGARGAHGLLAAATASAFVGSFLGARWSRKVTLVVLQRLVAALLLAIAAALGLGVL